MSGVPEAIPTIPRSNRRILIIAGPKEVVESALAPHEVLHSRGLDSAVDQISISRPDLVIYFVKGKHEDLEEHVMTWLIEGFRGKFLLFDPANRVQDYQTLVESQVVDEYLSGPVSPSRFISIIKSQLTKDIRFASPRAMTTFDLFRNLFDRGLNAIFFFSESFDRCVAANLQAEKITGHTLYELRHLGLNRLIAPEQFNQTLRTIRRAGRHYYDAKGSTVVMNTHGQKTKASFSCGVFNFGRKSFVKVEVQDQASLPLGVALSKENKLVSRGNVRPAVSLVHLLDQNMGDRRRQAKPLSMLLCRLNPNAGADELSEEGFLHRFEKILEATVRKTDRVTRLGHYQFAVLMPRTEPENAVRMIARFREHLQPIPEIKTGYYSLELEFAHCPSEAYPFMHLLSMAEERKPQDHPTH